MYYLCGSFVEESMKHNKLKRHLEARHSGLVNKERSHFETEEQKPKKPRLDSPTNSVVILVQQATLTSYLVGWRIARAKKANNIGEELVKPAALYMVRTIYRNKFAEKLENVPCQMTQFINEIRACRVT